MFRFSFCFYLFLFCLFRFDYLIETIKRNIVVLAENVTKENDREAETEVQSMVTGKDQGVEIGKHRFTKYRVAADVSEIICIRI